MKKILIIIFALLSLKASAQTQLTLPAYHWAYPYLHQLRLGGYLKDLNTNQQPYTLKQLVNSLTNSKKEIQQGIIKPNRHEQWLIDLLRREFVHQSNQKGDSTQLLLIQPGIWADEFAISDKKETKFYTQLRSQFGIQLGKNLCFYNGMLLDQSLLDDSLYTGEKWRGFAAYTEQAYLRFTIDDLRFTNFDFRFTIGRDFLNWGTGKTGRLLFSDSAQPMDHVAIDFRYKGLQFTTIAADLDQWLLSDSLAQHYGVTTANRFLSAHRLTVNFKNKFHLGLTEALLYGGPNSNWELKYHNPLLYYHGELLNGGGYDGNGFLYLDFDWYPKKNWEFYGEILVDDFQLEKTGSGDMEPNEVGLLFGMQHSNLLGIDGGLVGIEYVRIANRTYNSGFEWEKFVHFNRPIGYDLGNNFDRWHFKVNYFPLRGLQAGMDFDYIRKGEGSILDQWDTPWTSYTLSDGYDEPFPYGVVEKSSVITFNLKYHFAVNCMIESQVRYQNIKNLDHQPGRSENSWALFFKVHWDIGRRFHY